MTSINNPKCLICGKDANTVLMNSTICTKCSRKALKSLTDIARKVDAINTKYKVLRRMNIRSGIIPQTHNVDVDDSGENVIVQDQELMAKEIKELKDNVFDEFEKWVAEE